MQTRSRAKMTLEQKDNHGTLQGVAKTTQSKEKRPGQVRVRIHVKPQKASKTVENRNAATPNNVGPAIPVEPVPTRYIQKPELVRALSILQFTHGYVMDLNAPFVSENMNIPQILEKTIGKYLSFFAKHHTIVGILTTYDPMDVSQQRYIRENQYMLCVSPRNLFNAQDAKVARRQVAQVLRENGVEVFVDGDYACLYLGKSSFNTF
jgi:hypothetical protein